MTIKETVYNSRDNSIDLLLKADGEAYDLAAVTRMVLEDNAGSFSIDSEESADAFDWDTGTAGKVIVTIGDQSIAAGTYVCSLIVYDAGNTNGINWGKLVIEVVD